MRHLHCLALLLLFIAASYNCIAQNPRWESCSGPFGGTTRFVVRDQSGRLFASTNGGIYRSDDSGASWRIAYRDFPVGGQVAFTVDSTGTLYYILYLGTDEKHAVYRSTDAGGSWTPFKKGLFDSTNVVYSSLVVEPGTNEVFLSTSVGLYRVASDGQSWEPVGVTAYPQMAVRGALYSASASTIYRYRRINGYRADTIALPEADAQITSLASGRGGVLFAGTYRRGLFRSTDGGDTWHLTSHDFVGLAISVMIPSHTGGIVILPESGQTFRSLDDGQTWKRGSIVSVDMIGTMGVCMSQNVFVMNGWRGPHRSTDGGLSWVRSDSGMRAQYTLSLTADGNGTLYSGMYNSEIFRSTDDGRSWQRADSGLPTIQFPKVAAAHDGTVYFIHFGNHPTLYRSSDQGRNWQPLHGLNIRAGTLVAGDDGLVMSGTYGGYYYISTDYGASWRTDTVPSPGGSIVGSIAIDSGGGWWIGTDREFFRTSDQGKTWEQFDEVAGVQSIIVDRFGRVIVANTADSQYTAQVSIDTGKTWIKTRLNGRRVSRPYSRINGIVVSDSGTIVVATNDSLAYYSIDSGRTWKQIGEGLPEAGITWLARSSTGSIFGGTMRSGIYRIVDLPEPTPRDTVPTIPDDALETHLHYPYPNPFQTSIRIPYDIGHDTHAVIDIFNTLGERVDRLLDEEKKPGHYEVSWDAPSQSNGYYFVRLRADGVSMTLPVVLMR